MLYTEGGSIKIVKFIIHRSSLTKIGCLCETAYFVSKLYETYPTTGHNFQPTVFRSAQKACGKGFFGEKLFFFIKIENFYKKQQLRSKKALPARLLSEAKNSALCVMSK